MTTTAIAEQLKDRQAQRQTYINKRNEYDAKIDRVEGQIKALKEKQ